MSESVNSSDSIASDSTSSENQEHSQDTVAYESYSKLLKQKKARDNELAELKAELDRRREKELVGEGKKDEVIAAQRKQIETLESSTKRMEGQYAWNSVSAQIASEFASRGVRDTSKALKYAKAVHADDLKAIEIDEQFNANGNDLKRFVDKFLTENNDMGFTKSVKIDDTIPDGKIQTKKEKDISEMSDDELNKKWKQLS